MKDSTKKILFLSSIAAVFAVFFLIKQLTQVNDFHHKYAGVDLSRDVVGTGREGTYTAYLQEHANAGCPKKTLKVALLNYSTGSDVKIYENFEGEAAALYTGTASEVTWEIKVQEAGFYHLALDYFTVESRGVPVERAVYINGELPFADAGNITFSRRFKDGGEARTDNQGNEIRPTQIEDYQWQTAFCKDEMGYIAEPYLFYFEKGVNTITLEAINEPVVLRSVSLEPVTEKPSYEEYAAGITEPSAQGEGLTYIQLVEGEDSTVRSESSLYARYDRASATTQPYSVTKTLLNYIGGDAWRSPGQWIEWEFEVPENGWYVISIKGRQNYSRGSVSGRSIFIDGVTPFQELETVDFSYSNDWNTMTLSDEQGTPYRVYLEQGKHTIRMEATLGAMGEILEELENCTYRLNQIYRRLLIYTGANPDKYRDYHIDKTYPEIIEAMSLESKRLYKIVDDVVAYTGQKADKIATAQTLAQQLERFVKKPERITPEFITFKDNITALGTAVLNMSEIKLDVDYLLITGEQAEIPRDKANFFTMAAHEIRSFVASFFVDYDAVGDVYKEGDGTQVVKVWILSGRDQGTILKSMVDDTFTPNTGIKVNVEIVSPEAVMNAVVAGRGPNVILSIGGDQPVNYALRNAAESLSQFEDLEEVLSEFTESSYTQYYLGGEIYGIPETQSFNVMFYRTDILEELGLSVPDTWKELIEMLPTIQGNNMSVGIPSASGSSSNAGGNTSMASTAADMSMYFALLFQKGGNLYSDDQTHTILDEEAGVRALKEYTAYFTDYGLPDYYDFVSRFRSGEMPLGITGYGTYNTLMVSAPEIRGLWEFTMIPGTEKTDAQGNTYIDRTTMIAGTASMMVKTEDEALKQLSWEFMKWWANSKTQVRFGREMEALLGSSARYATANFNAFSQLAWNADDIEVLTKQWEQTLGIEEIPGGYYTGRHLMNAIRKIVNDKDDPRETILDYCITINEEITKKRKEFGLPVNE